MKREDFVAGMAAIQDDELMDESMLRKRIHDHQGGEQDIPVCIGELSELILELTRFQRNKINREDFLQELSHVQWAVWSLQDMFEISDQELHRAIQASFR